MHVQLEGERVPSLCQACNDTLSISWAAAGGVGGVRTRRGRLGRSEVPRLEAADSHSATGVFDAEIRYPAVEQGSCSRLG